MIAAFLCLLPALLLHRALLRGEAFVPADLLRQIAPWRADRTAPSSPWNVLRFDGITQFYPWRLQAARSWRAGRLPVWNPYAFAADGGTPLLANSQSAPLYPPNALFALLTPTHLAAGFGLLAALHLLIAASGMYRFARSSGISRCGALTGAAAFTLSAPVVTWLALPTFLEVTCWLPWLLLALRAGRPLPAGVTAGLCLLAGHLQMAFYVLLAATAYALWQAVEHRSQKRPARSLTVLLAALVLGGCLAAPQVLPAVELSRQSHRATAARPSAEGYRAYVVGAMPLRSLVTLAIPDFYGHPGDSFHWNDTALGGNNYAEWAAYVGIAPLVLALVGALLPWRVGRSERRFGVALAAASLLIAMGTPLAAPLYFLVPGFSQTGNPARILILLAFALALLAGFGVDALRERSAGRALPIAVVLLLLVAAFGASQGASFAAERRAVLPPLDQLLALALPGTLLAGLWLALTLVIVAALRRTPRAATAIPLLAALDLLVWGMSYNPTAPMTAVYPVTPGIAWLQEHARESLIAPINPRWSLSATAPAQAVLPPNALTVYALHDIAGYDSLFLASSKARAADALGADPCPPENGNMVLTKTAAAAVRRSARYLVTAPDAPLEISDLTEVYTGDDLRIYQNPRGIDIPPPLQTVPTSVRIGLFVAACALAALAYSKRLTG